MAGPAKPSPSVALDPVDGGSATSARRCSRRSLRFCHYARTLVSAARPKESSFLQRRTKFSERRSERPDVTEASSSRPPALRTGGKVFGAIPLTVAMRFALKTSDLTLRTSLRAGRSLREKQPSMRPEMQMPGPRPSKLQCKRRVSGKSLC